MKVRVVLADRREADSQVHDVLAAHQDVDVVATAPDARCTVLQARRTGADVVLVTSALRGTLPAICRDLRRLEPPPRTLLVDREPREESLLHAVESGVDGYVAAHEGDALAEAVRTAARGESVVPHAMLGPLLRQLIQRRRDTAEAAEQLDRLTRREREVFGLLVAGRDQEGIAAELFISPETARTHLQRVLRKLGVRSRGDAVALAARSGMADRLPHVVERTAS